MIYTQLDPSYKYDVLADAIYSREVEYFHYNFDLQNFTQIMGTLADGDYKNQIQERIDSTNVQMNNVKKIYDALLSQVDDETAYNAACVRAVARRAA